MRSKSSKVGSTKPPRYGQRPQSIGQSLMGGGVFLNQDIMPSYKKFDQLQEIRRQGVLTAKLREDRLKNLSQRIDDMRNLQKELAPPRSQKPQRATSNKSDKLRRKDQINKAQ